MQKVTIENHATANEFFHATLLDSRKEPVKCRRMGKTQLWKTRPNDFKIPVKHGLYDSFYITPANANEWNIK